LSRPIMARSRRESHHSDGITDQKNLQQTSATKSANSRHCKGCAIEATASAIVL
jgi:hypothetical protein